MTTIRRILSLGRPFGSDLSLYIPFVTLGVILGMVNITFVIPLFEILFDQLTPEQIQGYAQPPVFAGDAEYFKDVFYHYFLKFAEEQGKYGSLLIVCLTILGFNLFKNLFLYSGAVVLAKIRSRIIFQLRMNFVDALSSMHLGFFSEQRKGDVMSRASADVSEVEFAVKNGLPVLFKEPLTIVVGFTLLFYMSPKLTFFTVIFLPVAGTIVSTIVRRLRRKARHGQEAIGVIMNHMEEMLSGMRVIKAFNARNYIKGKFEKDVENYRQISNSMARKNEAAAPVSEFLGYIIITGILLYGGNLVLGNNSPLEPSEFLAYIIIFTQVMNPIRFIAKAYGNVQRGLVAADRVFEVIDSKPEIEDKPDAIELEKFRKEIRFDKVSFAYDSREVLTNIRFQLKKGKTIALVGPSGAGKSTIADLIPRFYDPSSGAVMIDGHPLTDYKVESIRQFMGIVTQESILFNDSVHNNIAFGKNVTRDEVIRAAKIANAHEFILALEQGYDTSIGERGTKLSGGQRQRISIARAILQNPEILLLDEATSALDTQSEKQVQDALINLMRNRTTLVIAHRLSTIQHADEIIVMQEGRIVERGSHHLLLEQEGLYSQLINMQNVN